MALRLCFLALHLLYIGAVAKPTEKSIFCQVLQEHKPFHHDDYAPIKPAGPEICAIGVSWNDDFILSTDDTHPNGARVEVFNRACARIGEFPKVHWTSIAWEQPSDFNKEQSLPLPHAFLVLRYLSFGSKKNKIGYDDEQQNLQGCYGASCFQYWVTPERPELMAEHKDTRHNCLCKDRKCLNGMDHCCACRFDCPGQE